jgi:hypothetical protein
MVSFIYGNKSNPELNAALCIYVAHRIFGQENDFGPCGSLGILDGDTLLGAVVFHNWQDEYGTIEISAAADNPRWLSKATIREIMRICFDLHRCQTLVVRQAQDNNRASKIFRFLGFKEILLPNMRGKNKHEILFLMTVDEWRSHRLYEVNNG